MPKFQTRSCMFLIFHGACCMFLNPHTHKHTASKTSSSNSIQSELSRRRRVQVLHVEDQQRVCSSKAKRHSVAAHRDKLGAHARRRPDGRLLITLHHRQNNWTSLTRSDVCQRWKPTRPPAIQQQPTTPVSSIKLNYWNHHLAVVNTDIYYIYTSTYA